jgi:type VI secretion system secreted protein VgrG
VAFFHEYFHNDTTGLCRTQSFSLSTLLKSRVRIIKHEKPNQKMRHTMLSTQDNIDLTIQTPLGKDALILDRFDGVEQISEPFCFSLDMNSTSPTLDLSALVGKEVQITYKYGKGKRYFCGVVGSAEQGWTVRKEKHNFTNYHAKVYPKFWMLKFTRDYRIFQNKSAMDIIKVILSENGVTEMKDKTTSCGKRARDYCVQYGESCFDFVCRLMEEEGIFYFFEHTSSNHTMILIDDSNGAKDVEPGKIEYMQSYSGTLRYNVVHTLRMQEQVVAKKFAAADYNFVTPDTHLYNKVTGKGMGGEVYDYPGIFMNKGEGDLIADHRIQYLEWAKITLKGTSITPAFCPMFAFTLKDHPRADWNKKFNLYRVRHLIRQDAGEGEELYESEFVAFPNTVPFRAPRVTLKPLIYSTQTAIVTTKSGEEIWCDEYGSIKVHFHWDQRGTKDEKSSCWIRVAQLWAGNKWGGVFTPRIGMEVVVTFLDGDPDRPLITGCVYNGKNANPYAKSEPTKSTIKSDTTKGGGGFNEFRYEDKKGSEQIFLHAQKDWDSEVEHSRTLLIKTGNDTTMINDGKRDVTLKGSKGGGNDTLTLKNGDQTINITGNRSATISKNDTLKITGNLDIQVTGNINIKSSANITMETTGNLTLKGAVVLIKAQAGATMDGGPTALVKAATATLQGSGLAVVTAPAVAIG